MKLLDQVRDHMRAKHLAIRTEQAYTKWITRFLNFERDLAGDWRHPSEMGVTEVNRFLTHLATVNKVSASTQTQALSALLLLFRDVLNKDIRADAIRAKPSDHLPIVLSIAEVWQVMREVPFGPNRLIAGLQYGAGMRLLESCRLRIKDVDFDRRQDTL